MVKKFTDIKFGETVGPTKGIFAKDSGGGDFETPEAGSYIARCYKIIDIGTQVETYQGKPSDPRRKVLIYWELLEDEEGKPYRMANGEPFSIMQKYTLSTNSKANLRKHIDAWRGKALTKEEAENFNVVVLLGKCCRLQVTLDERGDRTWVNVGSVGFTKKNLEGVNPTSWWTVSDPDMKAYERFPQWLQDKIASAEEWTVSGPTQPKTKDVVPDDVDADYNIEDDLLDLSDVKF